MTFNDTVDLNERIQESSFTVEWLLESLRKNDELFIKLHGKRSVKKVTFYDVADGKGFISTVNRCTIHFIDSVDDSDIYTTILKIPSFSSLEKMLNADDSGKTWFTNDNRKALTKVHEFECGFYNVLASIIDVPVPKVYKTVDWILNEQDGCLHMEDLTAKGKTISYFDNVNLTQIKCFIRHLAHWHKNILCSDSKIWKGKFISKAMEAFDTALEGIGQQGKIFLEESNLKDLFAPLIEKYHYLCLTTAYMKHANKIQFEDLKIQKVIVHSDMHSQNIMFAIDEEGNIQNDIAAFVDWQGMNEGSPMEDLAKFLVYCADGVVRRQAEQFVVEYYFECLCKEYGDINKVPYTLSQLKKSYNLAFSSQAVFAMPATMFFFGGIQQIESNKDLLNVYRDYGTLKTLHLLQDLERLLTGDLKEEYLKFNC